MLQLWTDENQACFIRFAFLLPSADAPFIPVCRTGSSGAISIDYILIIFLYRNPVKEQKKGVKLSGRGGEQRKYRFNCAPSPRLSLFGGTGHLPVKGQVHKPLDACVVCHEKLRK
jgi:hypothetical protein